LKVAPRPNVKPATSWPLGEHPSLGARLCYQLSPALALIFTAWAAIAEPGIDAGLGRLAGSVQDDGSDAGARDTGTRFQATAEAVVTCSALGGDARPADAHALPDGQICAGTEPLARRIIAARQGPRSLGALLGTLCANRNIDGGFGGEAGRPEGPFAELLLAALEDVAPAPVSAVPGAVLPVTLWPANRGIATGAGE
jgi:hypothetical protein